MRTIITILVCCIAAISHSVFADFDAFYVSLKGGYSKINDLKDTKKQINAGFNGGVALGKHFDVARFELDANHSRATTKSDPSLEKTDGNLDLSLVAINGYCDMSNSSAFSPYLGIGWGAGMIEFKDPTMGFQIMMGGHYYINNDISIMLEYRYSAIGDIEGATSHSISIGFKVKIFGEPDEEKIKEEYIYTHH